MLSIKTHGLEVFFGHKILFVKYMFNFGPNKLKTKK